MPAPSDNLKLVAEETVIFVCDIQTKFQSAIYGYHELITTVNKVLKIAKVLQIPVVVTEQNPKALGPTAPELALGSLGPLYLANVPKTLFSMVTAEVKDLLKPRGFKCVIIVGIESHVCVLQTTLDLLSLGYKVYIVADAVSSCNKVEVPIALARMRQVGAYISTSESAVFELMADSGKPQFKAFSAIIKEDKETTGNALRKLRPTFASNL
ncbi:Isochorismatase hydrolase [Gloeophyllum trabeum ATCC 11539]|uniref:Isochorismatase hydrolase n=1 Tax=Gloeophyllum trabeum (strain ATCC 11539 / FP-39264 / Madison 617) TaxID=670483 RepID=S7S1A8_GLOTA|nr:Isochorismatase hydrolase [Gloeophyllum trabeum ATCC 11539]EPQ59504.1 Isochorismatase hydrolase [Gloeophyllum trabeum ATCC 11539]